MIPFYQMSDEQLTSFCLSFGEMCDRIHSGEKMTRAKIKEICARNCAVRGLGTRVTRTASGNSKAKKGKASE